jgi:caa(3)-type oxidase subunit IV
MSDSLLSHALPVSPALPFGVHDVRREQRRYLAAYAVLIAGTALTVAMYYIQFDAVWQAVSVALLIAAAKATCVAAIFMHLWHGQRDVYKLLCLTGLFAAILLGLTAYSLFSLPGSGHYLR